MHWNLMLMEPFVMRDDLDGGTRRETNTLSGGTLF